MLKITNCCLNYLNQSRVRIGEDHSDMFDEWRWKILTETMVNNVAEFLVGFLIWNTVYKSGSTFIADGFWR